MSKSVVRAIQAGSLALSIALALGGAASAAIPHDDASAVRVRFAEADVRTIAGAKALAARIENAANLACFNEGYGAENIGACRRQAIASAVRGLDAPLLAEALGLRARRSVMASR